MGKLQEFEIELDKNKVVYAPGESISGTVRVKVNQSLQCKAIKVNCNGFCGITTKENDTAWTQEEQYFNSTVSVADKGTVFSYFSFISKWGNCFSFRWLMLSVLSVSHTGTLKQGEHVFPFKFLIPGRSVE
uniref:Arrestin-like N-terminal domain-containing protein n=1 Tax=Kryptolebias marmoratus TaxID=37003 RepID=A0A3Q3AG30_KRYMA